MRAMLFYAPYMCCLLNVLIVFGGGFLLLLYVSLWCLFGLMWHYRVGSYVIR